MTGTGKTLLARAVANRTDACFIRVIGSELVQKYVGEGARMVRELFQVRAVTTATVVSSSRSIYACILLAFSKTLSSAAPLLVGRFYATILSDDVVLIDADG